MRKGAQLEERSYSTLLLTFRTKSSLNSKGDFRTFLNWKKLKTQLTDSE